MIFKRILSLLIIILAAWYGVSAQIQKVPTAAQTAPAKIQQPQKTVTPSAQTPPQTRPAVQQQQQQQSVKVTPAAATEKKGDRKIVDFESDIMRPIKIGDSSVLNLLGNVVFYHNGAVITCDSALRYSDKRMECFKNVVVNKDQTYIYGDRADYNGDLNIARVYAPIIKMVDGDATMYTYNFSFNTLESIGRFSGGATISQKDNLLESERGYYYTDTRDVVCVERVELKSPEYKIKSDSLSYNMDTELARFFVPTNIWNVKGEILSADHGSYDKMNSYYHFTKNSYILTDKQELWADSIDFHSPTEYAVMYKDIQIRDDSNKIMSFGDFGKYWGDREEAMLTKRPSLINFDPEQDSLFMRADSMFLYTIPRAEAMKARTLVEESDEELVVVDEPKHDHGADSTIVVEGEKTAVLTETVKQPDQRELQQSLDADGQQVLTKKQKRQLEAEKKRLAKVAKNMGDGGDVLKNADGKSKNAKETPSDSTSAGDPVGTIKYTEQNSLDSVKMKMQEGVGVDGKSVALAADSLAKNIAAENKILTDSTAVDPADSMVRVVRGYFNVKIFRKDFQAVCDSLVGFSIDSTMHLYIDPVMWNEANQITADVIDVYSRNQALDKAVFTGEPIMISKVDSVRFNQVKGKVIEALFRRNEIYRTNVNGNGETLYYMTEDDNGVQSLMGFLVAECADITFLMANKQVDQIIYRGNPVYTIYPMEKIPLDQPQTLPGFTWEIERKPTMEEVFDREIKPSQREVYEAMPRPLFPITEEIVTNRERMIREGIWRDRNDKISVDVQSFIQGLGY